MVCGVRKGVKKKKKKIKAQSEAKGLKQIDLGKEKTTLTIQVHLVGKKTFL